MMAAYQPMLPFFRKYWHPLYSITAAAKADYSNFYYITQACFD
ncbi:MAG: hypothetical protein ACI8YD_002315 [Rheinheimera aquimaris]